MTEGSLQGFVPGEYREHPLSGMLSQPGGSHGIAPPAMDVLVCLVKRSGELISRREAVDVVG